MLYGQAMLAVRPEAREGRTPAEKQLWMQLHAMFVQEIEVRGGAQPSACRAVLTPQ